MRRASVHCSAGEKTTASTYDVVFPVARTRRLKSPWPFLLSATKRGLVQNLPPHPRKPTRLKPVRPADQWEQEALW